MSPDMIPTPPAGFLYEPSTGDWEGLKAYHPDSTYGGVWSDWTPEEGTTILLDVGETRMPLEQAREFARMLSEFVARHENAR